jgi:hypothetical protein
MSKLGDRLPIFMALRPLPLFGKIMQKVEPPALSYIDLERKLSVRCSYSPLVYSFCSIQRRNE